MTQSIKQIDPCVFIEFHAKPGTCLMTICRENNSSCWPHSVVLSCFALCSSSYWSLTFSFMPRIIPQTQRLSSGFEKDKQSLASGIFRPVKGPPKCVCFSWCILLKEMVYLVFWLTYSFNWDCIPSAFVVFGMVQGTNWKTSNWTRVWYFCICIKNIARGTADPGYWVYNLNHVFEIILAEQNHQSYGLNTLGQLCLWQCFLQFSLALVPILAQGGVTCISSMYFLAPQGALAGLTF